VELLQIKDHLHFGTILFIYTVTDYDTVYVFNKIICRFIEQMKDFSKTAK